MGILIADDGQLIMKRGKVSKNRVFGILAEGAVTQVEIRANGVDVNVNSETFSVEESFPEVTGEAGEAEIQAQVLTVEEAVSIETQGSIEIPAALEPGAVE